MEEFLNGISLPEEVRSIFISLCNSFVNLNVKWGFYKELYLPETNHKTLAFTANAFFKYLEESFRNDMTMAIGRLSDPSKSRRYENLSLLTLVEKCCRHVDGISVLYAQFADACDSVEIHRNKTVAHQDLAVALYPEGNPLPPIDVKQIDLIFDIASKIFNKISAHYGNEAQIVFCPPIVTGGAKDLVYWLNQGIEYYENRMDSLKKGHVP